MKIRDILAQGKPTLSFEVFPPKTEAAYESVEAAAKEIAKLKPSFMSVTYGAGGGTSKYTVAIASMIQDQGVTPLAHLTCVSSTKEKVHQVLEELKEKKIENILALRGDIPADGVTPKEYRYASQLIREIKESGDFCIGAACYPEGHVESANKSVDMDYLKEKVEAGCDFVTTQMFFDNSILYSYLYRIREKGITVPVIAGIMPVTHASQIKRITGMSGTYLPARFKAIVDRFGDNPAAMKQAGIAYATEQIIDLIANGVNGIHVYSMNKPDVAAKIQENLKEILA
ncbi:MAG: methylenetetrahydrofolate reductase [NAD(P)H] [Lachnospiraceae bacterium]|uniref:Methylenetetrahydrofolate reductase n=1 Tax=Candidatus Enterocloster excrementigallinarum TaxID=2838558 RepID=A0A9D2PT29_9FIRM|nr:methylenetetrahydrofolate reductase [NAD(P)H] [Lachnospiraceae bacterium]HJC65570.1 methylenetetrahydrofolate reductase [NAD(P)H] [Candidatus Enterocloster excrementigallinarum]